MAGLETYVSVGYEDIESLWHTLTEEQHDPVEELIERALAILPSQSPGLLGRLEAGTTPPEAVEQVIIQAVRRAILPWLVNPTGAKRTSQAIDDYTEAQEWDVAAIAAGLYFSSRELAGLAAPAARRGKAFTINTTPRH